MRDAVAECGPITKGDWIALTRDGDRRRDRLTGRRGVRAARSSSSTTTARSSPCSSARRAGGGDRAHPRAHRVRSSRTSRSSSTTAASRCTRTSSAWSSRGELDRSADAGDPPLTLRGPAARSSSTRAQGRRPRARGAARRRSGSTNVLDLLQHYPRRWVDRTKRAEIADARGGRGGDGVRRGAHGARPPDARRGARSSRSWSTTARRCSTSRSSTRRGARSSSRSAPKSRSSASSTCTAASGR